MFMIILINSKAKLRKKVAEENEQLLCRKLRNLEGWANSGDFTEFYKFRLIN